MYRGLIGRSIRAMPKIASKTVRYGVPNKVHSVRMRGIAGLSSLSDDYFGPVPEGQTWSQYESLMSNPVAVGASGAVIGAMIAGPVGAIVGGIGSWLASGGPSHTNKPKIQGG